ncbi:MAG: hypothetical protein AAGA87_10000 [Pseudomonadota bacterium]
MRPPERTIFVERRTYRRRRLIDAARLLPVFGVSIFAFPVLWARESSTTSGVAYLFGAWLVLIVLAFVIARRLRQSEGDDV